MSIYTQPSESIDLVAATTAYNNGVVKFKIKDIRADADGVVNILDARGEAVTFNAVQGETLNVRGTIEILATTTIAVQVYL